MKVGWKQKKETGRPPTQHERRHVSFEQSKRAPPPKTSSMFVWLRGQYIYFVRSLLKLVRVSGVVRECFLPDMYYRSVLTRATIGASVTPFGENIPDDKRGFLRNYPILHVPCTSCPIVSTHYCSCTLQRFALYIREVVALIQICFW